MLYLVTGANGAGKTLNTLKWVRERQIKENRPVYHNGRFEAVEDGELSSWKKIDFKDWQTLEDGAIILVDECHNDMPVRGSRDDVPEHIKMLAEHRRRGFDFYLISQHPQNIDSFVRRLIGSPGWHRHLKRSFGADMVSCLEWAAVNPNCEKDGSSKSAEVSMVRYPKEVYQWYRSASLHTGKKKIPKAVYVLVACVLAIPVLGYFGYHQISAVKKSNASPAVAGVPAAVTGGEAAPGRKLTPYEYVQTYAPRIPDFAYSAPRYDEVTRAVIAPYPAACVQNSKGCKCYTQQATLLPMDQSTCKQIVEKGFFMDWQQPQQPMQVKAPEPVQRPAEPVQVPMPPMAVQSSQASVVDSYTQGLAARNAQVRSVFQ
ncbi:zonular occludens toxin domain-containing protein [Comamonas thiooxydans]|uniref:zonular occludens toxin domain-containing protein n=1 Tax=Comamonas thiooxydans TaxID=363952 RepID=UPI0024495C0B|nr:zonular occludens toxin domain-containing protein [Comamonas thiooxydans]MDH1255915.1 zonular occludens toxin domain-containing protein [Comamonas thiooxydans]